MGRAGKPKGSVYRRADSRFWWLAYYDVGNVRKAISSGETDEAEAAKLLEAIEKRVRAERELGAKSGTLATLRWYATQRFLPARRERGVRTVDQDEDRLAYLLPELGDMLLKEIRPGHLRGFFKELARKEVDVRRNGRARGPVTKKMKLAPRTIHHVYGVLRVLFKDAIADELLQASPCVLEVRRGELPEKRDKNPMWRRGAIFTRDEVEQLISDLRIPEYRRVLWAAVFLGGLRINEFTPRRWREYDAEAVPLGCLSVNSHFDPKLWVEIGGTKTTEGPRPVPVHPVLAKVLAAWKLSGWEAMHGRRPSGEDLIIEAPRGGVLHSSRTLEALKEDCQALGMRPRRQHDLRRTFITLALAGGARKDFLRWVTHRPEGDVMDEYTTPPWATLCEQVLCLKIGLLEGRVLGMPATLLLRQVNT